MSVYEILIACVAMANLALALSTLHAARQKAATARLDAFEVATDHRLAATDRRLVAIDDALHRLRALAEVAITHEHLSEVYRDLKGISQQVHTLLGQQQQMNENLRLLLAQQVRG